MRQHSPGASPDRHPEVREGSQVVVPPHIRPDLVEHLDQHVVKGTDAPLFPAARGEYHLCERMFRDYFTDALESIRREGVRIHNLRHYAGTHLCSRTATYSNRILGLQPHTRLSNRRRGAP